MVVKAVLFDAVGTLIRVEPRVAELYRAVGLRYGADVDQRVIGERFAEAMRRENERDERELGFRTSEEREFARWKGIVEHVFAESERREQIFGELWDVFARAETWRVYDDAAERLRVLQKGGCVLGVASNFDRRLRSVVAGLPALAAVERCFVSSEIGYRKPSWGFFEAVQVALGLPPEAILLVGDDYESDFLAAQSCGWRGVLLDRAETTRQDGMISSLEALAGIL